MAVFAGVILSVSAVASDVVDDFPIFLEDVVDLYGNQLDFIIGLDKNNLNKLFKIYDCTASEALLVRG